MKAFIAILSIVFICLGTMAFAGDIGQTYHFSKQNGNRAVMIETPNIASLEPNIRPKRPIRNPSIMAEVLWIDRADENAIAENVTMVPDGSGIFVGWWLNHERFSAYASAGMNSPIWTYRHETDWWLPVDATDSKFCGTANDVPAYVWEHDSPLFIQEFEYNERYKGKGISFSGDGNLMAAVAKKNNLSAILYVYDLIAGDTIFTRSFVPTTELYGVDFSHDGSTIVVSNYGNLLVYSVPDGDLIGDLYNYSQNMAEISGDGTRVVIGTFQGNVILYEWNGTQYITRWSIPTGHDWVRAVAISTDGSTFGCGTIEFLSGGNAWTGKFMLIDADSGTVLIDYAEYGDEVCSVDISANGQYAIAGCYGQLDGTYGDVVTCFRRDTNIPIFQLLDDIDETGSIMGVAISDSGNYAVAGGKEVHARIMGNGGMVYSIKINDPLTNDVAVASIDEPGEFLNPGQTVIPTATYINVGENNASFTATCTITDIDSGIVVYSSSFGVNDLPSFSTSVVYFSPDFTMPAEGRYRLVMAADMANDEDPSNNDLPLVLRSWHDIKITDVIAPFDEVTYNWPMFPIAVCRNFGSYVEDFDVIVTIYDSLDVQVYTSLGSIFSLMPYVEEETQFSQWIPDQNGIYRIVVEAVVPDDYFPDDNIAVKFFEVKNEMIYDDGTAEVDIWVNLYPYSINRKFAQKFAPNLDTPFIVSNVRFYIGDLSYSGYFDYVGVAKSLGQFPDTNNFLAYASNPPLSGPGSWTSVDFNTTVDDDRPLWVVLHWADIDSMGPFIGGDETGILENQAYWYDNSSGWQQYFLRDWMIRLTLQDSATGIETEYISGLPRKLAMRQNYPNPFNSSTNIQFDLPGPSYVKLEIFSLTGAKIRTLSESHYDAGYHTVTWDGKSDSGDDVASAVYYYRLTSGQNRITRKMLMLK